MEWLPGDDISTSSAVSLDLAKASAVTDPPRPDWPRGDACGTPGINAAATNANDRLLMRGDFTVVLNIGNRGQTSINKAGRPENGPRYWSKPLLSR
jgi:hypothetical protein